MAHEVIYEYYEHYNAGNVAAIAELVSDDVVYWDTIYSKPLVGRQALVAYLTKVRKILPGDLRFVIEDATEGDVHRVGVLWHVQCGAEGAVLPFSHGCSFYQMNELGQISHARDVVEPSSKPGSAALVVLGVVTPLVRQVGGAGGLARLPLAAGAVWLLYAGYLSYVMLSTAAPGLPAYQTPPEVLAEVVHQSLNFFYVNIGLHQLGFTLVPNVATPPVSEALFNFVGAWSLLFLPVMLSDGATKKVDNKLAWWIGIMFITNVVMLPFMALRAAPEPVQGACTAAPPPWTPGRATSPPARVPDLFDPPPSSQLPSWSPAFGLLALAVGLFSVYWGLAGRPEYGDLAARWEYFQVAFHSNRVFFAFVLDIVLYSVWQAVLLEGQPAKYRLVPFFGLAAYCLARPDRDQAGDQS